MDSGDIGGLVGALVGGFGTAKLIGNGLLTATLGPAYIIGSTLAGYYIGHYLGHKFGGSQHG